MSDFQVRQIRRRVQEFEKRDDDPRLIEGLDRWVMFLRAFPSACQHKQSIRQTSDSGFNRGYDGLRDDALLHTSPNGQAVEHKLAREAGTPNS